MVNLIWGFALLCLVPPQLADRDWSETARVAGEVCQRVPSRGKGRIRGFRRDGSAPVGAALFNLSARLPGTDRWLPEIRRKTATPCR